MKPILKKQKVPSFFFQKNLEMYKYITENVFFLLFGDFQNNPTLIKKIIF